MTRRNFMGSDACVTNKDKAPEDWGNYLNLTILQDGHKFCVCSGDGCNEDPAGGSAALGVTAPLVLVASMITVFLNY